MKQLKILLLLIGLTYPGIARSDLIMTDFLYHQYRFTNVDKYPEIALIQVVFSERKDRKLEMVSEIKSDQLYKRWDPYPIYLYIVRRSYLESKNLYSIDWKHDPNVHKFDIVLKIKNKSGPRVHTIIDEYKFTKSNTQYIIINTAVRVLRKSIFSYYF